MSAVRPHKSPSPKPQTCPECGNPYEYRVLKRLDEYPVGGAYRHSHGQHVYVHGIQSTWFDDGGDA